MNGEVLGGVSVRIIGGTARGMTLAAPKGLATRPTGGRAREALFNILNDMRGVHALDLFAGSGAIGVEALSRGAARAVFVERSAEAAEVIRRNIAKARFTDRAETLVMPLDAAVRLLAARKARFGFIYADPPYRQGLAGVAWRMVTEAGLLADGGAFAIETAVDEAIGTGGGNAGAYTIMTRRYGAANIHIIRRANDESGLPREL